MAQKQIERKSRKVHIPESAWEKLTAAHQIDGVLYQAFFPTKCEIIHGFCLDIKSYTRHEISDAHGAVLRKTMEDSTGTKGESIALMKYFLGWSRGQLKTLATNIRLRHFQTPNDLPDISEVVDHTEPGTDDDEAQSDTAVSCPLHEAKLFEARGNDQNNRDLFKDRHAKNPSSTEFGADAHILYEYIGRTSKGLWIENLNNFQKKNGKRTVNDKRIKAVLARWKFSKTKYSPLKPDFEFAHLTNRKNPTKRKENKDKRRKLKDFLQLYKTVDLPIFKKHSDLIGEDRLLNWDTEAEFKKDVYTALLDWKDILKKKSYGLGSQWTMKIRLNPLPSSSSLPNDVDASEKTKETSAHQPKKQKKSLP